MGREIDQRVVEMRFDNQQFENNVHTSMGTIDKLKQKLDFKGMSKGLDGISASAKKVDMSPIAASADTVGLRFSAMYTMADQALRNITNSAMNYGKRIVSALTIDPIRTGLSEYETKINAIQVMHANTRGKNTMEDITKALDDLNTYADKTIYNFAQMTSNVGKFTAQGYDVYDAANAVKGLANLAAASGASAEDMARATYQMSQALGGTIRLIDWNSLRNANMATVDLKNTLIDLAKVNGVAIDDMIEKHGTFEQTLSEGWLTGDMFTEAMNIYSGVYSEAELKAKGFTDAQVKNFMDLAATAESAATEVKTFTQLWDVLKETAQSGWTQTWELIFGDFETAKKMWTNLQNYFSVGINKKADSRNTLLGGALNMGATWDKITAKLDEAGIGKIKKVGDAIEDVTDKIKYFQDIVDKVWRGDFGNSDTGRYELLEKAGYDHRVVQDLVNKGKAYKLTVEDIEESHRKFGLTMERTNESTKETSSIFANLTDEQLKNAGLTEAEIKLYRDLAKEADRTGVSVEELIDKMSKKDGRTLLIESLKNAWSGLSGIFKALKNAWKDIFPPISVARLYNIISAINAFSINLRLTVAETGELNETGKKLQRTFEGVFALLDIILTLVAGPLKIALSVFAALIESADLDILSVTAAVGDAIVAFRDWLDSILNFDGVAKVLVSWIRNASESIRKWIDVLKTSENIPLDIAKGLLKGFKSCIKLIIDVCKELGKTIINTVKNILGIHSPSTEFIAIGKDIIAGLVIGIKEGSKKLVIALFTLVRDIITVIKEVITGEYELSSDDSIVGRIFRLLQKGLSAIWGLVESIASAIKRFVGNVDLGTLIAAGISILTILSLLKLVNILDSLVSPLETLKDLFNSLDKAVKKVADAKAWQLRSKAMLNFAFAIGILAIAVFTLAQLDYGKLWSSVGAITVLALVLAGLMAAMTFFATKLSTFEDGVLKESKGLATISKMALFLLSVSVSLFFIVQAAKSISDLEWSEIGKAAALIAGIGVLYAALIAVSALSNKWVGKAGKLLTKMAWALLLMVGVVKLASKLDEDEISKGLEFVLKFGGFLAVLIGISKLAGPYVSKAGSMTLRVSLALLTMIAVVKLASKLEEDEISKGIEFVLKFGAFLAGLVLVSKLAGQYASKAGSMLLKMAVALLILVGVAKLAATMKTDDLNTAIKFIGGVGIIFALVVGLSKLSGQYASKAGSMLLKMSVALLIISGAIYQLSKIDPKNIKTPLIAMGIFMTLMTVMIGVSKLAGKAAGSMFAIALTVAILSGVLIALSVINPEGLWPAVAAISALMIFLSILMTATGKAGTIKQSLSALVALLGLSVVLIALAGVLNLIAPMDIESAIPKVLALSILLGVMVLLALPLSFIGKHAGNIAKGSLAISLLAIPLGLLGLILGMMTALDVQNGVSNAIALSVLLGAMTLVAAAMALLGNFAVQIALGSLALSVLALPMALLGLILAMMSAMNVENAIPNAQALVILIGAITLVAAAMALLGNFAIQIVLGSLALTALMIPMALLGLILAMMSAMNVENAIPNAQALVILIGAITAVAAAMALLGNFTLQIVLGSLALAALMIPMAMFANIAKQISVCLKNLGTFGPAEVGKLEQAADCIVYIAEAINKIPINFGAAIADFFGAGAGDRLAEIGKGLSAFHKSIKGVNTAKLERAASALASIANTLNSCKFNSNTVSNLKKALKDLGDAGVESFIKAFEDAEDEVRGAGEGLVEDLIAGVESKAGDMEDAFTDVADSSVGALNDCKSDFYSAGTNLSSGFANGISAYADRAISKARSMAISAANAIDNALRICSPSKVTYKSGNFFGMGFVKAIGEYENKSYVAGEDVAVAAKNGLGDAIKRVADVVDSDIDTQPTIRPVLDLSDVRSGAGALNGMFDANAMLGVTANVGAINTMMNRRIQNDRNADIVHAIDKLDKDLRSLERPSYTVNGITYDDGSNVSDAVQSIIRALRIERRT